MRFPRTAALSWPSAALVWITAERSSCETDRLSAAVDTCGAVGPEG